MAIMYCRSLVTPNSSFFLFGPRGTGKTTWLRAALPEALWFNLLLDSDFLPLLGDTRSFRQRVVAAKPGSWIVIDEVQRLPSLLNEVHDLISVHGKTYRFALSGSSARKLRRLNANMLAGRAFDRKFFPLTSAELGTDFELERAITFGTLPAVATDLDDAADILQSYVGTYLREEVQQEALVQSLDSFGRFLKVAALMNGNQLEYSATARDCGVARKTVERYFATLVDTLVAFLLPAWQPKLKIRETNKPKFYFFDAGVVRQIAGKIRTPVHDLERGHLLETYLLHELRAASSYLNLGLELSYYGTGEEEVDIVISQGDFHIGIEIKSSVAWRRENGRALKKLIARKKLAKAIGVYRGDQILKDDTLTVLPVSEFLKRVWSGDLMSLSRDI